MFKNFFNIASSFLVLLICYYLMFMIYHINFVLSRVLFHQKSLAKQGFLTIIFS